MSTRPVSGGRKIVDLIAQCVAANQPMLLRGKHGIGKSELFKAAADTLGIGFISRDLSLMEPSDLIGIPYVDDAGRTRFAPPSFLPSEGSGLFTIEEINRAPRYMIAPCLQLLTERRLNDYVLPPGWIPMAAINPGGADYHVDELDPALLARFVQIEFSADAEQWAYWARDQGYIHEKVIEFAEQSPGIFASGETNPRALTYLSKQVHAWEAGARDPEILLVAAAGLLGETWAIAFCQFLNGGDAPLLPVEVLDDYACVQSRVLGWASSSQLDLVRASMQSLQRHLDQQQRLENLSDDHAKLCNLREFMGDLPGDLNLEMRQWLADRKCEPLAA
ncbi:MAG: AAA family ATPase [Rubripirellula sp.]